MTSSPIFRIPLTIPGASANPVDLSKVSALFPVGYETDAVDHWILGEDDTSYTGKVNGLHLAPNATIAITAGGTGYTPSSTITGSVTGGSGWVAQATVSSGGVVASARFTTVGTGTPTAVTFSGTGSGCTATVSTGTAPTLSRGYLSTAASTSGSKNGLMTPMDDSATQTVCAVIRRPSAGAVIFGSISTNSAEGGSALLYDTTPSWTALTRGGTNANPANPTENTGDWLFVALAEGGGQRDAVIKSGAVSTTALTKTAGNPARKFGLGNTNYASSGYYGSVSVAELVLFSTKKTAAELATIYANSKARMASRGINVL